MPRLLIAMLLVMVASVPAVAVDRSFEMEVENSLKGSVPKDWFLRASWRDESLVVFVSPPVPQSFEIWYDSDRQKTILQDLCQAVPQSIWGKVGEQKDIAMEQVVGGNGGKGSWRLSCRQYLAGLKEQSKTN